MTNNKTDIVIIEDNNNFREAAEEYFSNKVHARFAPDFLGGINEIIDLPPQGAIIDCFMPYAQGSSYRDRGFEAIEKMLSTDETGQRIEAYEKEFSRYIDLDDELRKYARMTGFFSEEQNPQDCPILKAVEIVSRVSREIAEQSARETLSLVCKSREKNFMDYYYALRKAIEEDPSNQPLGILLGEVCKEKEIPFVLATSTYHHDELTQPIQNYCRREGWTLIDCTQNNPNEKATFSFWQRAYEGLLKEMKK